MASEPGAAADPEVPERAARRRFTAEFKRRILEEVDRCAGTGEIGAVLRKNGLYSSHLTSWRRQRDEGTLAGLSPRKRGRKPSDKNPLAGDVARLERELARMQARAERAEGLLELQKKAAELFGRTIPPEEELLREEQERQATAPRTPPKRRRR